jgi:hypothetical protein
MNLLCSGFLSLQSSAADFLAACVWQFRCSSNSLSCSMQLTLQRDLYNHTCHDYFQAMPGANLPASTSAASR